ncbi:hypothetical protein BDK51DRAFT_36796 [Blyttiomyces helicus]|uniref:Uncharacterized protein n=1 Tax=Blyttiomyces helicus TaxID=388810 RepID=A0A4P9W0L1_9FUNG|nr:hypothetical protein BDK51DRAFT_36796 [Blyttiomyces helicus]|eukprot:RKO84218.1 hypothetical protein BDK51DRAFT_36796 [Blyttiomyces helicus]
MPPSHTSSQLLACSSSQSAVTLFQYGHAVRLMRYLKKGLGHYQRRYHEFQAKANDQSVTIKELSGKVASLQQDLSAAKKEIAHLRQQPSPARSRPPSVHSQDGSSVSRHRNPASVKTPNRPTRLSLPPGSAGSDADRSVGQFQEGTSPQRAPGYNNTMRYMPDVQMSEAQYEEYPSAMQPVATARHGSSGGSDWSWGGRQPEEPRNASRPAPSAPYSESQSSQHQYLRQSREPHWQQRPLSSAQSNRPPQAAYEAAGAYPTQSRSPAQRNEQGWPKPPPDPRAHSFAPPAQPSRPGTGMPFTQPTRPGTGAGLGVGGLAGSGRPPTRESWKQSQPSGSGWLGESGSAGSFAQQQHPPRAEHRAAASEGRVPARQPSTLTRSNSSSSSSSAMAGISNGTISFLIQYFYAAADERHASCSIDRFSSSLSSLFIVGGRTSVTRNRHGFPSAGNPFTS